jgi:hypothetical protein
MVQKKTSLFFTNLQNSRFAQVTDSQIKTIQELFDIRIQKSA